MPREFYISPKYPEQQSSGRRTIPKDGNKSTLVIPTPEQVHQSFWDTPKGISPKAYQELMRWVENGCPQFDD